MILNHLSQYRLGIQLDLCIFGALPPIRHSSNDRFRELTFHQESAQTIIETVTDKLIADQKEIRGYPRDQLAAACVAKDNFAY